MELVLPTIDEKLVYLNNVAVQLGWYLSDGSLCRKTGWFSADQKCLSYEKKEDHIQVDAWGCPKVVLAFCAHLEKSLELPVKLTFRSDEPYKFCDYGY